MTQHITDAGTIEEANELAGLKVLRVELLADKEGAPFITLERCAQRSGPDLWAIRQVYGMVFGRDGNFAFEPQPSSRDEVFYQKYRFATAADALRVWREHLRDSGDGSPPCTFGHIGQCS